MAALEGKVAIITGGAGGQGVAIGTRFIAEGASVVLADVLDAEGKAVADEIGAHFVHLDVTDEDAWNAAVAEATERFGDPTILLNGAGILKFGRIEDMPVSEFMHVVSVNQLGVFLGMKAVFPAMRRAGGGSIINVSSVEGLRGSWGLSAYVGSKFAVRGMTKTAASEGGKHGIRVNSIHPGVIDTPMIRQQGLAGLDLDQVFRKIPARRAGTPQDIAGLATFLASDDSSYCTGAEFVIDGGATSFIGWGGPTPTV